MKVGWGVDFDDNRHPRIRIGRGEWSAVLYNHPANGWEVVTLEVNPRSSACLANITAMRQRHAARAYSTAAKTEPASRSYQFVRSRSIMVAVQD
jgi:hypothetical protein